MIKTSHIVIYSLMVLAIGLVGYIDIALSFRPIGSFFILIFIGIAWGVRRMVAEYFSNALIPNRVLFLALICIFLNFCIGIYLNDKVAEQANEAVVSIERFYSNNGYYPDSLLEAAPVGKLDEWSASRIKFGAHYYYLKNDRSFAFGFDTFPFGGKRWDPVEMRFQVTMD